jgi:hypothetical protein
MYAKLIDGQLVVPPQVSRQPDGSTVIGYDQRPDLLTADGFKPVVETPRPGDYYAASWQDDGAQITQVWTAYEPPAPVEPTPALYPDGIETPVVILQSNSAGYGIGLVVDDEGEIATYIDHQSPRPDAAERAARITAAIAGRKAEREAFKALLDALASGDQKAIKDAAKAARGRA